MDQQDSSVTSLQLRIWGNTIAIALVLFNILVTYIFFTNGRMNLQGISNAIAGTAAILIGTSFAFSGISYYFNEVGRKIYYRKYLGLAGFWLALFYALLLLFVDPSRYFYGFFQNLGTPDVILGLSAMSILTMMAFISRKDPMVRLGPKLWRRLLRLGYIAYGLLILRAFVLEKELWASWLAEMTGLPPLRFLISIFALLVIFLRISIELSKLSKGRKEDTKQVQPAVTQNPGSLRTQTGENRETS